MKKTLPKKKEKKRTGQESRRISSSERRQEVLRSRIILGCIIASIIIIAALALLLPKSSQRFRRPVNMGELVGVSSDVLQYTDAVASACREYDIQEYSTLLMALMQQESSGQGTDIFQCSESPFNTEYSNEPGSITDTAYSIRVGVETFAYCLEQAGCKSISDTNALKLALQEYNYGNDYAAWALENYGGYSEESALAFSEKMKAQLGWETYGDPQYVQHVLQYINL
ncbi:MAG: lysozyme family protein [Eubacteriales bacterium]|nr:lysozyme family protein [Eubacteriales bacterium]